MATRSTVTFGEEKPFLALYECRKCRAPHDRLVRWCPTCRGSYTLRAKHALQAAVAEPEAATSTTDAIDADLPRVRCGIDSIDEVFGGGITLGSVNMCWGRGGLGKSSIFVRIAGRPEMGRALLMQSEQPKSVVMATVARLKATRPGFDVIATNDLATAIRVAESREYNLLIADSLQEFAGDTEGNVTAAKRVGKQLVRLARRTNATMFIVSHSIGTGRQAGGEYNVHGVDATYEITGDLKDKHGPRWFGALKNRFGPSGVTARFRMGEHGLEDWPESPDEVERVDAAASPPKDNSFNRRARPKRPVAR